MTEQQQTQNVGELAKHASEIGKQLESLKRSLEELEQLAKEREQLLERVRRAADNLENLASKWRTAANCLAQSASDPCTMKLEVGGDYIRVVVWTPVEVVYLKFEKSVALSDVADAVRRAVANNYIKMLARTAETMMATVNLAREVVAELAPIWDKIKIFKRQLDNIEERLDELEARLEEQEDEEDC
ncbi:MAG: hypothetical protein QXS85_06330 [Acidilobaceae archaeon]